MNQNKIDLEAGAPEMHLLVIHCLLDTGTYEGDSTHMINEKPGIDCWLLEETVDQANPNALLFAVRETTNVDSLYDHRRGSIVSKAG